MKIINVKGPIVGNSDKYVYDFYGIEATAPKDILDNFPLDGSEIQIDINSGGGLVNEGAEIYTALRNYSGKVTVNVVGTAASSASLIAMAGDAVKISPVGRMMIHNVTAGGVGDYRDMDKASEMLITANTALANAYSEKTKIEKDDILKMMDSETWLNAEKAKELGFADEIMFDDEPQLVANAGTLLPQAVIRKFHETQDESRSKMENTKSSVGISVGRTLDIEAFKKEIIEELNQLNTNKKEPEAINSGFSAFLF